MTKMMQEPLEKDEITEMVAEALGVRPLRIVRQPLSNSGKTVCRLDAR